MLVGKFTMLTLIRFDNENPLSVFWIGKHASEMWTVNVLLERSGAGSIFGIVNNSWRIWVREIDRELAILLYSAREIEQLGILCSWCAAASIPILHVHAVIYVFWCKLFVFLHIINGIHYVKSVLFTLLYAGAAMFRSFAITGCSCTIIT